ncbi:MAG: hypothetical protein QG602_352 [Verrucomicrobiota bacterium]|nr:hypothetical protein [Verrucomicrobiota bacterium]
MSDAKRFREDFGNRVPMSERVLAAGIFIGAIILAYDVLLSDRATFIERRGILRRLFSSDSRGVVVLHGWPIFWIFLVLVLVGLIALTFLLDHYDRRFNERFYVRLRRVMLGVTAAVMLIGTVSAYFEIWSR